MQEAREDAKVLQGQEDSGRHEILPKRGHVHGVRAKLMASDGHGNRDSEALPEPAYDQALQGQGFRDRKGVEGKWQRLRTYSSWLRC